METTENISPKSTLKNILLAVFGIGALSAVYFSFEQSQENLRLQEQLSRQKNYVQNDEKAFAAIEDNLAELSSREGIINDFYRDNMSFSSEERIVKEIAALDELIYQNNKIVKSLTDILGAKDERLLRFKRSTAFLEKRMRDYETRGNVMVAESQSLKIDLMEANNAGLSLQKEVTDLQKALAERDEDIDSKAQFINWQSDELEQKEAKIRTAYYVVGTYKDLSENNVVEKKGGFVGIGATRSLKKDFARNAFHKIDIYSNRSIPVFGGDVSILTNHRSDSYELSRDNRGNVQWINILDPDKFWESSKYLVVAAIDPLYQGKTDLTDPDIH